MGRTKLAACAEAAVPPWEVMNDTTRTHLIRMYPDAIRGTLEEMEAHGQGRPFGNLTPADIAELNRLKASMQATRERLLGAGVLVVGATGIVD